jgi:hypothetical protein
MSALEAFQIRPLAESDLDFVMESAGGVRAHRDADRRSNVGADYKLGRALIELKGLDEEGFTKVSRQEKLAVLFQEYEPARPVIVLDRHRLKPKDQARFDRIIEGPIKTAIAKANRQLKQSRAEQSDATCSVLIAINNGYTTLDHEAFKALVAHRVRQDTHEIDAVVVAGAYYHSDGFDSYFLWPIDCIPINLDQRFAEFEQLRTGWNALADRFMTQLVRDELGPNRTKGPVADTQFEVDGITYIRPAPIIGAVSKFYVHGRPRKDSSGLTSCPPVGRTFPSVPRSEWLNLEKLIARPSDMFSSYQAWKQEEAQGQAEGEDICPFVTVPITAHDWTTWCSERGEADSIFQFANERFSQQVHELIARARELEGSRIVPARYVLAITDVIGQDRANDLSHIVIVNVRPNGEGLSREMVKNARIFHEHAIALAAAYAVRERVDAVMWSKNLKYAWV